MKSTVRCVLTINGGSSSIRFAIYEAGETPRRRLDGKLDRIGLSGTTLAVNDPTGKPQVLRRRLTAVLNGRSIDTSMGFTPTAGMVMSTRTGDLDPGLVYFLARTERMTAARFQKMVNHDSGLLGVSGSSSNLREHLPELKIRVVNVIDLMKLQPQSEHPHGLSDTDFDELFTKDKPVIFAFHGYPWLIHRLTYRRTNHDNIHVRGYKEEGTITTPFDMTVLNDLHRFHLVMDTIDRVPQTGDKGIHLKQQLKGKLIEHKQYIDKFGQDMPEIRNWKWDAAHSEEAV